jgi:hypothetical protein
MPDLENKKEHRMRNPEQNIPRVRGHCQLLAQQIVIGILAEEEIERAMQ